LFASHHLSAETMQVLLMQSAAYSSGKGLPFGFFAAHCGLRTYFMMILSLPHLALYFTRSPGYPGSAARAVEAKPE